VVEDLQFENDELIQERSAIETAFADELLRELEAQREELLLETEVESKKLETNLNALRSQLKEEKERHEEERSLFHKEEEILRKALEDAHGSQGEQGEQGRTKIQSQELELSREVQKLRMEVKSLERQRATQSLELMGSPNRVERSMRSMRSVSVSMDRGEGEEGSYYEKLYLQEKKAAGDLKVRLGEALKLLEERGYMEEGASSPSTSLHMQGLTLISTQSPPSLQVMLLSSSTSLDAHSLK